MPHPPTSPLPPKPPPRDHLLAANIHISTLQFIAALLLTLMLLWHISTVSLVENYQMPPLWVQKFLAEHANEWKVFVWGATSALVSGGGALGWDRVVLDCLHALWVLDWWCALLHGHQDDEQDGEEGNEDWKMKEIDLEKRETGNALQRSEHDSTRRRPLSTHSSPSPTATTTTDKTTSPLSSLPYTYHPLLHPRLPQTTQTLLLSALDLLVPLALAGYSILYFFSLRTALKFCESELLSDRKIRHGERNVPLSQRDLCLGLNVDIHVAGGFAVFVAFVLGLLHLAALGVRVGEGVVFGRGGVGGDFSLNRGGCAGGGDEKQEAASPAAVSSLPSTAVFPRSSLEAGGKHSTDQPRDATSLDSEERSAGVRLVDWSAERAGQDARRRANYTDESRDTTTEKRWAEALLECLLP